MVSRSAIENTNGCPVLPYLLVTWIQTLIQKFCGYCAEADTLALDATHYMAETKVLMQCSPKSDAVKNGRACRGVDYPE